MKNPYRSTLYAIGLAMLLSGSIYASRLKVYNMHYKLIRGFTNPLSRCDKVQDSCAIFPYVSIFKSNSVTYSLPNYGIQEFHWRGVIGARYKAVVNLEEHEHATLEVIGDGYYKFKGKKKYAEIVRS